ncbi:shikimate kinase [Clostridium sp.]|uniref:shikimate kinase n=1 Tax=Clostridium sp. TaxID=1506 RepID=UPI00291021A5|nr:shikimate kinase [Clostridium sp.]MDU7243479.1 shikimate kinase [Clostridium sp.]
MDKNIILLIGMPGCGKSTIGEELANKINYDFCDMDKYIEEISNSTVKELFNISEEYFRDYETLACKELSNKSKIIISSGGGVIKRKKNIDFFKDRGIIIFIDRPIEDILKDVDTSSRPLLSDGKSKLYNLYSERYNLYNNYCEIKIVNDTTIEETIDKIIKII